MKAIKMFILTVAAFAGLMFSTAMPAAAAVTEAQAQEIVQGIGKQLTFEYLVSIAQQLYQAGKLSEDEAKALAADFRAASTAKTRAEYDAALARVVVRLDRAINPGKAA